MQKLATCLILGLPAETCRTVVGCGGCDIILKCVVLHTAVSFFFKLLAVDILGVIVCTVVRDVNTQKKNKVLAT